MLIPRTVDSPVLLRQGGDVNLTVRAIPELRAQYERDNERNGDNEKSAKNQGKVVAALFM